MSSKNLEIKLCPFFKECNDFKDSNLCNYDYNLNCNKYIDLLMDEIRGYCLMGRNIG